MSVQNQRIARESGRKPALSIDGLIKEFKPSRSFREANPHLLTDRGTVQAVRGISLDVYPGEVVVLLGANGAGKTTTLSCAQGLQPADGGTLQLLGENPWGASPELRAQVGIMLQDGGLPQAIHPIELLKHIAKMYKNPASVDDLVQRLGINEFNGTTIRRLSGGQKQRVALAAALVGYPKVLFLDEPSAGLDPQSRTVVFDIIREQRERGVAIVLTTHLLDDAQRLADYVYIVKRGENVTEGTVAQLLQETNEQAHTVSFTAASAISLQDFPAHLRDSVTLTQDSPGQYSLTGELTPDHLNALTTFFVSQGIMPSSFTLASRTLEDVFLDISGRDIR